MYVHTIVVGIYIYYTSSHVTVVEGYLPRALAGLHIIYVST